MILHKNSVFHVCLWRNLIVCSVSLFCPRGKLETTHYLVFICNRYHNYTYIVTESHQRYLEKLRAAAVVTKYVTALQVPFCPNKNSCFKLLLAASRDFPVLEDHCLSLF